MVKVEVEALEPKLGEHNILYSFINELVALLVLNRQDPFASSVEYGVTPY